MEENLSSKSNKVDSNYLKKLLEEHNYQECISILKNKIIQYIVCLIQKKMPSYEYTTIIDLIQLSEICISDERKEIAKHLEYFSFEENETDKLPIQKDKEILMIYTCYPFVYVGYTTQRYVVYAELVY